MAYVQPPERITRTVETPLGVPLTEVRSRRVEGVSTRRLVLALDILDPGCVRRGAAGDPDDRVRHAGADRPEVRRRLRRPPDAAGRRRRAEVARRGRRPRHRAAVDHLGPDGGLVDDVDPRAPRGARPRTLAHVLGPAPGTSQRQASGAGPHRGGRRPWARPGAHPRGATSLRDGAGGLRRRGGHRAVAASAPRRGRRPAAARFGARGRPGPRGGVGGRRRRL